MRGHVMTEAETPAPRIGKRGRKPKYPWEEWVDGTLRTIKRGEDFDVQVFVMQSQLHTYAAKNGFKVETETSDDLLTFRFFKITKAD